MEEFEAKILKIGHILASLITLVSAIAKFYSLHLRVKANSMSKRQTTMMQSLFLPFVAFIAASFFLPLCPLRLQFSTININQITLLDF